MRALRLLSLFVVVVLLSAATGWAQCSGSPAIPNFQIAHTTTAYTLTWGPPSGVQAPVYEVMQATRPTYCPGPIPAASYSVIGTTSATSFTVQKTIPNAAYFATVRVQSNTCITTDSARGADTFASPPAKPGQTVVASAEGGHATVRSVYNDYSAVAPSGCTASRTSSTSPPSALAPPIRRF